MEMNDYTIFGKKMDSGDSQQFIAVLSPTQKHWVVIQSIRHKDDKHVTKTIDCLYASLSILCQTFYDYKSISFIIIE